MIGMIIAGVVAVFCAVAVIMLATGDDEVWKG